LGDDRLVITISDNADLSEAWHTYYHLWSTGNPFFGPYSLNRYPTLPTLLPGSISLSPPDLSLQIVSFISRGAIWDCFALSNPGQVVKMTCPGMFDRIKQDADERYTEIVARRSVVTEMEVFSVMKDLQGSVVPRLGGLWGSVQQGKETWCLVMEHGGQRLDSLDDKQWSVALPRLPSPLSPLSPVSPLPVSPLPVSPLSRLSSPSIRGLLTHESFRTIVEDHYRRIHERGVSHGDVDPRHWLWNKTEDGAWVLRIIDFERATVGDEVAIGEEEEYLAELRMTGRL